MADVLASEVALAILALLVVSSTLIGFLVAAFIVLPRAWRDARREYPDGQRGGRSLFARYLFFNAVMGTVILFAYVGVSTNILFVENPDLRSALARVGIVVAVLCDVAVVLAIPIVRKRMARARTRQLKRREDS